MALCLAIQRDFEYDPKATDVETKPSEAFALKKGVCQDFAHVMIAGLRGMSIPAGYVSGFLRTIPPAGQARLEGADAMHAWVRVWCGTNMGWVEFDPTNAMIAGADHISIGHGRDYADISPIVGVLRTHGSHETRQSVDVIKVE
jgi:transglutaminase-like putative cysteine protease